VTPRKLRPDDEATLWASLSDVWDIGRDWTHYWYPLSETKRRDVAAFQAPYFRDALAGAPLAGILRAHGIDAVLEFREGGGAWEIDVRELDPAYTGDEGFWSTRALDWVIYASHENSITVGGTWLLESIRRAWPAYERHVWSTPFFA